MPRGTLFSWGGRRSAKMKVIPESSPKASCWHKASWDPGSPHWSPTSGGSTSSSLHTQDSGRGPYGMSLGERGPRNRPMDLDIEKYDPLARHLIGGLDPESSHQPGYVYTSMYKARCQAENLDRGEPTLV
jgi:hypothetical protein